MHVMKLIATVKSSVTIAESFTLKPTSETMEVEGFENSKPF